MLVRRLRFVFLLVCITASVLASTPSALAAPPSNDNFANAQVISGSSGFVWGENLDATEETGEPNNAGESAPIQSVWYSWTAPQTAKFFFQTCETNMDTTLGAYTGSAVNSLTKVADNDDACGWSGWSSHIVVAATSGTTYYFSVDGWEDTYGDFVLEWDLANDDFADARSISGESGSIDGRNHGFTGQTGEPDNAGVSAPIESAWYTWTAPKTGRVAFDTCATTDSSITFPLMDTTLGAYTGSAVNALEVIADNNDSCGHFDWLSQITFHAQSGSTYYISVDGFDGVPGLFTLSWEYNNDYFDSAEVISGSNGTVSGDNINYTAEPGEPDAAGFSEPIQSAWYKWTAPESAIFRFDTCASEWSTTLGVYIGSSVDGLTAVAENFEGPSCPYGGSQVTFAAEAGTTYYISVDGFGRLEDPFVLQWGYGVNLVRNPGFEVDGNRDGRPDSWSSNARFTRRNALVFSGNFAGRHRATDNSSYVVQQSVSGILPDAGYYFSVLVNIPATADNFEFRLQVRWKNGSNKTLRTDTADSYTASTSNWSLASNTLHSPRGAKKAQLRMVVKSLKTTIYVDDFVFTR